MAEFPFTLQGEAVTMLVTAVRGHLYETEFDASAKNWRGQVKPGDLFTTTIERKPRDDMQGLANALVQLARRAHWLVLWLDCDREGEAICFEARQAHPPA